MLGLHSGDLQGTPLVSPEYLTMAADVGMTMQHQPK
jgi:hypothetical protein